MPEKGNKWGALLYGKHNYIKQHVLVLKYHHSGWFPVPAMGRSAGGCAGAIPSVDNATCRGTEPRLGSRMRLRSAGRPVLLLCGLTSGSSGGVC